MESALLRGFFFKALLFSVLFPDAAQYLFHRDGVIGVVGHLALLPPAGKPISNQDSIPKKPRSQARAGFIPERRARLRKARAEDRAV